MSQETLLHKLICRGDEISIINGKLTIVPVSNQPVPQKWLNQHSYSMISEIAKKSNSRLFSYTGEYNVTLVREKGYWCLKLDCIDLLNNAIFPMFFKVEKESRRSTGKNYKGKQFYAGKRSDVYKVFSKLAGFPEFPLTKWHEYLGRLQYCFFVSDVNESGYLDKGVNPVNLTVDDIYNLINFSTCVPRKAVTTHNIPIEYSSETQSILKRSTHSNSAPSVEDTGMTANNTVCVENTKNNNLQSKNYTSQTDTTNEWLNDYDPNNVLDKMKF